MSRARELAKVGGKNQQIIAGLSSHVGVSTFADNVFMYSNLEVTGTTAFNGGTLTLGDNASDNVVFGADVNSHIIPNTDDTYDLGSSTQEWRNLYIDGTANIDTGVVGTMSVGDLTDNRVVIAGTSGELEDSASLTFDGTTLATTNATFSGNVDLGNATSDTITATARFDSDLVPSTDNARDLGASGLEWKDLYLDGTANIDALSADSATLATAAVSDLTDGRVVLAGTSGELEDSGNLTFDGSTLTVTGALAVSGQVDWNGDINLGNATGDTVTLVGRFDSDLDPSADNTYDLGGSGLEWKDIYIDGTAYLDTAQINQLNAHGNGFVSAGSSIIPDTDDTYDLGSSSKMWRDVWIGPGSLYVNGQKVIEESSSNIVVSADANQNVVLQTHGSGDLELDPTGTGVIQVKGTLQVEDGKSITNSAGNDITLGNNLRVDQITTQSDNTNLNLSGRGSGNVTVNDNLAITGDLSVTGGSISIGTNGITATTINATGVATATQFVGAVVGSTISASSNVDFNGDLDVDGTTNLDVVDIDGAVDMASNLVIAGNIDANGDLDVDGTTNLDVVDIDGAVDMASNLTLAGNADFNGDLDVDGTTNLDVVDIDGAVDMASSLTVDGTVTFNTALASSNLATSGVSAGTVGSSTAIPIITVNNKGLVTSTSTTAIDTTTIENGSASVAVASNGPITSTGNHDFTAGIDVTGNSTFANNVTITGSVDANGGASIDNVQVGVSNDNEIDTSSGNLVLDSAGGTTTVDDNLVVSGNLTVNGTTNTVNSTTVTIADKNFQVATGSADDSVADGGGLTVDSGDGDKTWNFEATGDNWGSSENINAASGKVYKINNTSVLSATTLGSGVVASSLTSVGTIASGVWQGTAIANGYLANSSVSYGGVSLSLGGSDGTPAFDLSDATNYPTSSLSGTITNAQLAGSIANGKLSNSSVSYGGVSLSLGGSDGTPAFDLSDATNYPTSSLSGTITNAQLAGSIASSKLASTGVSAGTVGSSTAIPIITVNAQGQITSTSTTAVDSTTIENGGGSVAVGSGGNVTVTGDTTFLNHASFGDDDEIRLGAGTDGTIYSDGDNFIMQGSGTTYLRGSTINFGANGGSGGFSDALVVDKSGSERVQLRWGSSQRLVTTSAGVTVTGNITVSGTVDGRDVASDGSKLDGIESAATADQTASEILTLIKTVDGAGSGLDADTLDGISSASFLRSDTSDTFSGTLTVSGNILPNANGTRDLGASGTRWANVYSSDLDLSNEAKGGNTVDGTWGSYLIEEGEDNLYLTNRRSGKKFRFVLEAV